MASIFRRPKSNYWQVSYLEAGQWKRKSTGYRCDDPDETRKAEAMAAKLTYEEKLAPPVVKSCKKIGGVFLTGWDWVPAFLKSIARAPRTLEAYKLRWRRLSQFLTTHGLNHPQSVRYEHAEAFLRWREAQKRHCGKPITHNTAVIEAKMMKTILAEAALRGLVDRSPWAAVRPKKDDTAEKPEITAGEQAAIEAALQSAPAWMFRAWTIAMATGCRLRETRLDLRRHVDFEAGTITFPSPKGGRKKAYTIPLPDRLRGPLAQWLEAGDRWTLTMPPCPSKDWRFFLDALDMPHLCFHCTRVTFISKLARANVPLAVAMRLVNHASRTIHRIYQRINLDDLRQWADRIELATHIKK
jgi:integrase